MNRRKFLSAAAVSMISTSVGGLLPEAEATPLGKPTRSMPNDPNVVLIICDDLGYGDLGCYGGALQTPNLDKMASEGTLLTHCNTAHPTCSAARAAILTGQYASRVGVSEVFYASDTGGMNLGTPTIASMLKRKGYHTAAIGKWHLGHSGDYLPHGRGFDEYFGVSNSVDATPNPLIEGMQILEKKPDLDTLTQRYTERGVEVIKSANGKPFFLYLAHSYPHIPIHASSRFRGKSRNGIYGDAVMEIDWSVGEIHRTLRERGLEENTLVMFTSDHGPWFQGNPGRLKGRKDTDFEGGVRVPFLARWKGQLQEGRREDAFFSTTDVLPTIAAVCNASLPDIALDGVNEWAVLAGTSKTPAREGIVLYTSGEDLNVHCARKGNWKLRFGSYDVPPYDVARAYPRTSYTLANPELYNLCEDPTESYDVASSHPDIVQSILAEVDAKLGTFPPDAQKVYAQQKAKVCSPYTTAGERPQPAGTKALI